MKFFIDTANLDEIAEAKSWGCLAGVTTNPSLYAKTGGKLADFEPHIDRKSTRLNSSHRSQSRMPSSA